MSDAGPTLDMPALGLSGLQVTACSGEEGLNICDHWWITVAIPQAPDPWEMLDTPLRLSLPHSQGSRYVHGILNQVEDLEGDSATGRLLRVELRPRVWCLQRYHRSRTHACEADDSGPVRGGLTVIDIIRGVLSDHGLGADDVDVSAVNVGSLVQHSQMVQYQESDLDFLRRWCEREGLVTWFEHRADREVWCIADDSTRAPLLATLPWRPQPSSWQGSDEAKDEQVVDARLRWDYAPESLEVCEHDWRQPDTAHRATVDISPDLPGHGLVQRFDEAVKDEAQARHVAELRSQQLASDSHGLWLRSDCRRLASFHSVEISGHHHPLMRGAWLPVRMRHHWQADSTSTAQVAARRFSLEAECVPADRPWRPARSVPWPRIAGSLPAMIVAQEAADGDGVCVDLDERGRYLVRQAFDDATQQGVSSRRVRALGPSSLPTADGRPSGMHFPLPAGTEVAVMYRAGDPDRPLIIGAVPNRDRPSPITEARASGHLLRTPGGHRLRFDEDPGGECMQWGSGDGSWSETSGRPQASGTGESSSAAFVGDADACREPSPMWASSPDHASDSDRADDLRDDTDAFWQDDERWRRLSKDPRWRPFMSPIPVRIMADQTLDDRVFDPASRAPGDSIQARIHAEQAQLYRKNPPQQGKDFGYGSPADTPGPLGSTMPKGSVADPQGALRDMHQEVRTTTGFKGYQRLTGGDVISLQHGSIYQQRWGDAISWQHGDTFDIHQHGTAFNYFWDTERVNWGGGTSYSYDPEPEEMSVVGLARLSCNTVVSSHTFDYVDSGKEVALGGVKLAQKVGLMDVDFALQKNLALSITAPVGKSFSHRLAAEANFYTSPGTEITVPSEKETGSKKGASIAFWLKIPLVSQESAAMSQEIEMTTMGVEGGVAEIEGSDTEMRSSTLDIHDALSKLQSVDNSISTSAAEVE